jgi:hypothetical protein
LADSGLITRFVPQVPENTAADGTVTQNQQSPTFGFQTTDKGMNVHRALLDTIYEQLLHVKTVVK